MAKKKSHCVESLCSKCKNPQEELYTMYNYMGYGRHFKEDDWFCKVCFEAKLKRVNKERERAGEQIYVSVESERY